MSVLSIVLLLPLVYFSFKGFKRGLIVEVCSLAALVLGAFITFTFADVTYRFLAEKFPQLSTGLGALSYILTFILVVVLVKLLAKMLTKLIDAVALGFINKALGFVFGGLKALVLLALLSVLFESINGRYSLIPAPNKQDEHVYMVVKYTGDELLAWFANTDGFTRRP